MERVSSMVECGITSEEACERCAKSISEIFRDNTGYFVGNEPVTKEVYDYNIEKQREAYEENIKPLIEWEERVKASDFQQLDKEMIEIYRLSKRYLKNRGMLGES